MAVWQWNASPKVANAQFQTYRRQPAKEKNCCSCSFVGLSLNLYVSTVSMLKYYRTDGQTGRKQMPNLKIFGMAELQRRR